MKRFIEGQARDHSALLPECPEDCSDKNNPVRVIDAFVEAIEQDIGRPAAISGKRLSAKIASVTLCDPGLAYAENGNVA